MEPLAYIEVVDRHRDVVARHPVYGWPARIGRGYTADVILDDPFVAPLHAVVEPVADGRFTIRDLGSLNGLLSGTREGRIDETTVGPDDLVSLGHTQLRIRTPAYAVARERPLEGAALYRRFPAFFLAAALLVALLGWNGWIMTTEDDHKYAVLFTMVGLLAAAGLWIALWSFASSATGRGPNFSAHGFVACAGIIVMVASETFFEYLSFAFDAGWIGYAGILATATILAYLVYRHLMLNSRARRRTLAQISAGVTFAVFGVIAGLNFASDLAQDGTQGYNDLIKAPAFLFVSGTAPEAFLSDAQSLKREVDAMAKRD